MNLLPALALLALASDDVCSARLDNLLSLYHEYELPVPPPDAQLVWMSTPRGKYLEITRRTKEDEKLDQFRGFVVKVVKPEPASLTDTDLVDLDFVLHCHARGWKSLSRAAFRQWLAKTDQRAERELACDAWRYWVGQLSEPKTPLPVIAKHLKRLLPLTGLADERDVALLRSLELSLVPSKSAPGSDDALIDELIESSERGPYLDPAYKALARRGFDAVPALIAHLGDDRLTRHTKTGNGDFLRVKEVVYWMLCDFAGKNLTDSYDRAERTFAAGRWFADALKMGEEEYVVANVGRWDVPPDEDVLFPLLVEKYPRRLPEAYRNFIARQKTWDHLGTAFAKAIVEAAIPQEEKVRVLEFAAAHANPYHREAGLRHLLMLDPDRGRELLLAGLEKLTTNPDDAWLARLVGIGTDPKAWETLDRVAKRVSPGVRVALLTEAFTRDDPTAERRRLQFAFVSSHLTDADAWDAAYDFGHLRAYWLSEPLSPGEVRNYAAVQLLSAFGLRVEPKPDWTAQRWAGVRECARIELEHDSRR
jgi:hypothetical protein